MTADTNNNFVSEEQIARSAYEIWEREGRPEGRSTEHWLQAELMLRGANLGQPADSARSSSLAKPRRAPASKAAGSRREKKFEMVS